MQILSPTSYVSKCVLGFEILYFACLGAGYLPIRSAAARQLHQTLFETLPGFVWGQPVSIIIGACYVAVIAALVGAYCVWMHNSSLVPGE